MNLVIMFLVNLIKKICSPETSDQNMIIGISKQNFYLRRFSESRSSNGSTPSVLPTVRPQHFWDA